MLPENMRKRLTIILIVCAISSTLIYANVIASSAADTFISVDEFFTAIDKGNVDIVQKYIRAGNSINVKSEKGYSPLHFLFYCMPYKGSNKSQEKIARLLLDAGANVNEIKDNSYTKVSVFYLVVQTDDEAIVNLFIRRGANKEARIEGLFAAASRGHINICKRILDSGIDVNSRDKFGQTPLFLVSKISMAKYLVSRGADVNAKTDEGESVLDWLSNSVNETDHKIISYLMEKGAKKTR